jgi:hypothetical protein
MGSFQTAGNDAPAGLHPTTKDTENNREAQTPRDHCILNKVTTVDSVDGPTDAHRKLTAQIKGAIAGEKERRQPPAGWLSYIRTLGDNVSSKIFDRNFKQKHANNTIGSLHVTLDWNDAESKAGETTIDKETLGEAADYYRWLYRGKKAGGSLSFFTSLLKRK